VSALPRFVDACETFTVEYACPWSCRIELDLNEIHQAFRRSQMRASVDGCHQSIHEDPDFTLAEWFTWTGSRRNTEQGS
jgi:hypothetical protein